MESITKIMLFEELSGVLDDMVCGAWWTFSWVKEKTVHC